MVDATLWQNLVLPMARLLFSLTLALLLANILEALHWTRYLSRLAAPLARSAHLGESAQAAFTIAFLSPAQANALLSEAYTERRLSLRELTLANLFNSLPAYFVHTPTIFLLTWPVLGYAAIVYVGLSLLAAFLRTLLTLCLSRKLLPPSQSTQINTTKDTAISLCTALARALHRLGKRLPRLLLFTVPIYLLMYYLQTHGLFEQLNAWLGNQTSTFSFLTPQAAGIIMLHFLAEFGSALGAAGSLLSTGGINDHEVVIALLVGNILSTPIRALRHQLPSYAGFFNPSLGLRLIVLNQGVRAASMALVTTGYCLCT